MSLKQLKEEEVIEPGTKKTPTTIEGNPKRVMLMGKIILNHGQRIRLPEMDKVGIGAPSTIWKVNFMECT